MNECGVKVDSAWTSTNERGCGGHNVVATGMYRGQRVPLCKTHAECGSPRITAIQPIPSAGGAG